MKTTSEELILEAKRAKKRGEILVPKIERFMRGRSVDIEDGKDIQFLEALLRERSRGREEAVYSPSSLGTCVRKIYFTKTGKERRFIQRTSTSGYFLDGNFRHFKWQFVLWKMHRAKRIRLIGGTPELPGTEIRVYSNSGDLAGTLDNLVLIDDEPFVVDWKGMGNYQFLVSQDRGPDHKYILQGANYTLLAREDRNVELPAQLKRFLIIGENKNGIIPGPRQSPLGLKEWVFDADEYRREISSRLKSLRAFERKEKTPPPECVSTGTRMFIDCPYSWFCLKEVKKIERDLRKEAAGKNEKPAVNFSKVRDNGKK